ncbi:MAG: nucleotidyl transferase AbiEii/AbiGii toxin family protein [Flavobacteriaceae bacterium]|nr:nucleotidyl transferase AbiEii/AbiGii toxin family protein [Flavobacteriaceae bacterium]
MKTAISKELDNLLLELMNNPLLDDYFLVGGTNLAYRYNHRESIDLDLFTFKEFSLIENQNLNIKLNEFYKNRIDTQSVSNVGIFTFIDNIKVDLVRYPYPLMWNVEIFNNMRFAHPLDIGAMKLSAITDRGSRKDFYDIHRLLKDYPLSTLLKIFQEKYKINNQNHVLRSLTYFNDAEDVAKRQNNFVMVDKTITWNKVKNDIKGSVYNLYQEKNHKTEIKFKGRKR